MAINHILAKPEKIVATGVGLLEQELVIPNIFQKEGIDQFKGAPNDTVNVVVEGLLPFHDFAWRSGESNAGDTPANSRQKLTFDRYVERKVPIAFGGNVYSAVEITDEQKDFDFNTWTDKILKKQVRAVARGLGRRAVSTLTGQTYSVVIGDLAGTGSTLRGGLLEARRVLNRFNVPQESRVLLVGTDFEAKLLSDPTIVFAQNAGDARADSALGEATLGRLAGFTVVVDQTIPATEAYALHPSAFIMLTGAPAVPQSVKQGATQAFEGIAMRWLTDYSADYLVDRSVVNTYAGFRAIKDDLVGYSTSTTNANANWNQAEIVSSNEHFVRAIKLKLDGASVYPVLKQGDGTTVTTWDNYKPGAGSTAADTPASAELALFTGVTGPGPSLTGASATLADD